MSMHAPSLQGICPWLQGSVIVIGTAFCWPVMVTQLKYDIQHSFRVLFVQIVIISSKIIAYTNWSLGPSVAKPWVAVTSTAFSSNRRTVNLESNSIGFRSRANITDGRSPRLAMQVNLNGAQGGEITRPGTISRRGATSKDRRVFFQNARLIAKS